MRFNVVLAALAVVMSLSLSLHAAHAAEAPKRVITLTGSGKATVEPDMATMTAGVITQAKTARDALSANTARMTEVIDAFKAAGVPETDLQTANFSVQPQYHYERTNNGTKPPVIVGYQVQNQVVVVIRDLSILGQVLDRSVDVGANTISGPHFGLADRQTVVDRAREKAAADALRKAELYAAALNVTLGPILTISEGQVAVPQRPVMARAMMADAAEAAPVPIEGGDIDLTAEVSVTWSLAD